MVYRKLTTNNAKNLLMKCNFLCEEVFVLLDCLG